MLIDTWELMKSARDRHLAMLLITHVMDGAGRSCGIVTACAVGSVDERGTPGPLAAQDDAGQRMRFRISTPFEDDLLTLLPEVETVTRRGSEMFVSGHGNLVAAVTSVLARHGVIAEQLRIELPALDDAFVALTGRYAPHTSAS